MDKKQAMEILEGMIHESKHQEASDALKQLRDKLILINVGYAQPLFKAIKDTEEVLKKASAVNLSYSEKGKEDMKKIDPQTKLPGVMLDKGMSPGQQAGNMGSSNMTLTPGVVKQEKVGGAPSSAPPMMANQKQDGLKSFLKKFVDSKKAPLQKEAAASTGNVPPPKPKQPSVSIKVGSGMMAMGKNAAPAPAPAPSPAPHKGVEMIKRWKSQKPPIMKKEDFPKKQADIPDDQKPKEMSGESKRAITEPKDQPIKISAERPGQANQQSARGKLK